VVLTAAEHPLPRVGIERLPSKPQPVDVAGQGRLVEVDRHPAGVRQPAGVAQQPVADVEHRRGACFGSDRAGGIARLRTPMRGDLVG
jgi:hypothetical protein